MEFRHILCPVDLSDLSGYALRYAAMVAGYTGGRLTAAYANSFPPPPYFTSSQVGELEKQFRESFQQAETAVRLFVRKELGGEAAVRVVEAAPADAIRHLAEETAADLVVMGTHGRSGVNRLMLGSVTERVLRETKAPVLVVRGGTGGQAAAPQNILCPVNDTAAARAAFAAAAQLANRFGAHLTALHVQESGQEHAIGDLCSWIQAEPRAGCSIQEHMRSGEAAKEIVTLAREAPCDLLVIGSTHRRFFDSTVLGSTTARVMRHAPCPVLMVPMAA